MGGSHVGAQIVETRVDFRDSPETEYTRRGRLYKGSFSNVGREEGDLEPLG